MWPRVIEIMLGFWLVVSTMIFEQPSDQPDLWRHNLFSGSSVILFALLSFWHPLRRSHLATCGVALLLIGLGYVGSPYPTPPALQNYILTGLVLLMLGIIPGRQTQGIQL